MTMRLFLVIVYMLIEAGFFLAAIATKNEQKRQTRLLFAIYFALCVLGKEIAAIAIHTGAFPLWNNR